MLGTSVQQQQYEMERQVPDVIDLTVMAVESGMGMDGALDFISNRLSGPLAEECRATSQQAQRAADPGEAWLGLCQRVKLPDLSDFVGALLHSRSAGTSLGDTLRQKSEDIRHRRLHKAREEANQLPVKLIFVNVVLVPCMIVELISFLLLPGWLAFLLLVPAFLVLASRFLAQGRHKELDKADRQLSEALTLASGGLRVGHGLDMSLESAAKSAHAPVGPELERVSAELRNGTAPPEAFDTLRERFGSREVDMLVTGLEIQRTHGGSLADILDRVARLIADRVRVRGEIRALTSQGQFSAYLMTGIPLVLAAFARLVGIKLIGVLPVSTMIPFVAILMVFVTQAGIHRTVKAVLASVDRFMP